MTHSLGEQLRMLREERNLTLQQVAAGTHIRPQYVEALENDERERLPSAVQGKGFVRVIAGFLNVPVEPLLAAWDGIIPEEAPAPAAGSDSIEPPAPEAEPLAEELSIEELQVTDVELPLPDETEVSPSALAIEADADPDETDYFGEPIPIEEPAPSEAGDIFVQIGAELRRQRETISLTLDDVERFTKVRIHYLQALEDGRFDDLPSPVQGRGMLANYANFLNLDTDALLLRFADALQIRRLEQPANARSRSGRPAVPKKQPEPKTASPAKIAWRRMVTPDLLIGGLLFLSMLGFVIWGAARVSRMTAEASVITPPSISEVLQITATGSPTPENQSLLAGTAAATQALAIVEGGEATALPEGGETSDPDATADPNTEESPAPPQAGAGAVQIHVIVNQRAFLRIVTDGETTFNGRVAPGSAYTFSATEQLELLTGNAAALQVFFRQEDLGTLGLIGQVVSLVFSTDGVVTPTPQPTPTGQPTPTPTPTVAATNNEPVPTITPYIP